MGFTSRCLNRSRSQALTKLLYVCSEQTDLQKDTLTQKYSTHVHAIGILVLLNVLGVS